MSNTNIINYRQAEDKVLTIRSQSVILDSDVAELYGVETKRINEAVKNNPDKFPSGYIIELNTEEWDSLRSKFSTIKNLKSKISTSNLRSKISTANLAMTRIAPKAFTEKGLYMLATVLKSPRATQTTIAIVETFTKIRELTRTVAELSETPQKAKQKSLMQRSGEIIAEILDDNSHVTDTETSIEINFALMKFKHVVKQKRK